MVCVSLLTIWRESTQYSSDPAFWDKGIEIVVLKEMQDRSTQATPDFDVCYVFNLKIWLRTSIVLEGSVSISKEVLLQRPGMLSIRKAGQDDSVVCLSIVQANRATKTCLK